MPLLVPVFFLFHAQLPRPAEPQNPQLNRPPAVEPVKPGATAGPGAVATGPIDETPVVTHHQIGVNGKTLNYTATVAQMPINASGGENEAHIFYMAHTLDDHADPLRR